MERVAALILQLAEGRPEGVVVGLFN